MKPPITTKVFMGIMIMKTTIVMTEMWGLMIMIILKIIMTVMQMM